MRHKNPRKIFLLPKTTEKVGTRNAKRNITMWYNHQTLRYTYEPSQKEVIFNFELPGKSKDDVKVFSKSNAISVKVDNKDSFNINLEDYYELLDNKYDYNNIKAEMNHGLLKINIPKKYEKLKVIEIT